MRYLQWTYAVVWFLLFFQSRAQDLLALLHSLPACAVSIKLCALQDLAKKANRHTATMFLH
jgi:hypothetical protein